MGTRGVFLQKRLTIKERKILPAYLKWLYLIPVLILMNVNEQGNNYEWRTLIRAFVDIRKVSHLLQVEGSWDCYWVEGGVEGINTRKWQLGKKRSTNQREEFDLILIGQGKGGGGGGRKDSLSLSFSHLSPTYNWEVTKMSPELRNKLGSDVSNENL